MSLQEAAEAAARSQGGETSTASAAPPPYAEPTLPQPTGTAVPPTESVAQTTETAATLPESVTQPLHNANDPIIPQVPGDSGSIPTSAAEATTEGGDDEEKDALQRAKDMSSGKDLSQDVVMSEEVEGDDVEDDEEAAIARAIAMSLEEAKGEQNEEMK